MLGVDLFCGIGGFHYAAKENGIDIIFASEIDKQARAQYKLNHGLEPHGDITTVDSHDIPDHDILFAGFPCQPFSVAGKRKGFEDTRGTLFFEIARILRDKKPEYFLLENVKGLVKHDGGNTLKTIGNVLFELGYYVKLKVLNAKYFGVPQNRERLFLVGFRDKEAYFRFQFPEEHPENVKTLLDILEPEVDEKYYIKDTKKLEYVEKSLQLGFSKVNTDIAQTMLARQYSGRSGTYIIPNKIGVIGKNSQGTRVYSSLFPGVTLMANGGGLGAKTGLYQIGDKIRKLSPRECARLQGFPENYRIECSDNQAYKQFGNSVAVPCVSAIIQKILKTKVGEVDEIRDLA